MAKLTLKKAATDVTVYLFAQNSSKTTGEGLTGLAYNTASLTAYYVRPLGSATAITLATQTVTGAHSDGGFKEVDATNMPGVYRLDLPDAVCATGVPSAIVMLKGAANLAPVLLEIQLTDFDLNTAFTSALVADAVCDEALSGHTSAGTVGKAIADIESDVDAILVDTGTTLDTLIKDIPTTAEFEARTLAAANYFDPSTDTVATVTNLTNLPTMPADWVTASGLKADAVTEIQSGLALEATLTAIKGAGWTDETLVKIITDISNIGAGSGATAQEVWEYATRVLTAGTNIDLSSLATAANLAALDGKVDTVDEVVDTILVLSQDTASDIAAVKSVVDDILVDTGTTLDGKLNTIDGIVDDILVDTGTTIPATLTTIDNFIDTEVAAILEDTNEIQAELADGGRTDLLIDAIKAKTDNLPASPAATGAAMTLTSAYDAAKTAATQASVNAIPTTPLLAANYTAPDNASITAIKAKTDNLPADPADDSDIDTQLAAIKTVVDAVLVDTGTTLDDLIDTEIAAIKAKTDLIPATPAQAGEYTSALSAIQADLDNPSQYKADVSGLATSSALATVDTVVDGIATTLANPDNFKADVSGLATSTELSAIDDKIDTLDTVADGIATTLASPDNFKADVSALALESTLDEMKGAGWSTETLAAIKSAIDALSSGGFDPAVIAAAILDALLADHTVAGSVAKAIADILEDTGTTLSNLITSIKAKTDLMDASAITYTPNVVGTDITLLRGDTFSATLTDVGALTGYVSIDFTVKRNTSNTDDEAIIRIRKNASGTGDGLLRLNRAAPTTETGEIVVDDEATGDITITLDETATDSLEIGAYLYDVQLITATAVKTLTSGRLNVTSDVTRAIV